MIAVRVMRRVGRRPVACLANRENGFVEGSASEEQTFWVFALVGGGFWDGDAEAYVTVVVWHTGNSPPRVILPDVHRGQPPQSSFRMGGGSPNWFAAYSDSKGPFTSVLGIFRVIWSDLGVDQSFTNAAVYIQGAFG